MGQIPLDIEEVFKELKVEIVWLHARWIIYRQLFGHSEKRIELLNECARAFFYIIQDVIFGEVLVALSKLTDPARTGKRENLSLEQLQQRVEMQEEKQFAVHLKNILNNLHNKCQAFREWRNKKLAHLDLLTTRKSSLNPLPGISRQMIEDALKLVREYMNTIDLHFEGVETDYELFVMNGADGEALISLLKYGLRYEELIKDKDFFLQERKKGEWQNA
jgi:hypothetical protein